jgi:hypothetical protein
MFDFQERRLDQLKAAAFTNATGCFSHVFVCLCPATAVSNHQDTMLDKGFHAATPDS